MESKSIPIEAEIVGFGYFFYLILTSLIVGFGIGLSIYGTALLISLIFPPFRRVSDRILQKSIEFVMRIQFWMKFDSREFGRAYGDLRRRGGAQGVLLVSNHRSHLDTFLLLAKVSGIRVLAKRELFAVPLLGFVMWTSRQIPVRRKNLGAFVSAMDAISDRLRAGEVVHVFPEMTRAPAEFRGVAGFNAAPFLTAMKVGVPIFPFAIAGTAAAWPKGSFSLKGGTRVALVPLSPIAPDDFVRFAGAKELAEHCRAEIETAYLRSNPT